MGLLEVVCISGNACLDRAGLFWLVKTFTNCSWGLAASARVEATDLGQFPEACKLEGIKI